MTTPIHSSGTDASFYFADSFASVRYEDLSPAAIDIAKKSVIDTIAVSLAATSLNPDATQLALIADSVGCVNGCRILGFGGRAPAPLAAWVNGGLSHALDFDDIAYGAFAHPSAAVVPAMFAIAEHVGKVSGKEFITSLALAQDMVVRLSEALDWKAVAPLPWLPFPLVGTFAAAAACARLLKLDRERIQAAIAGALAYTTGTGELQHGGLRGLYDSWAAQGGVLAALVAQRRIKAPLQPLEGPRGFFQNYWHGAYDRDRLLSGLGQTFRGERTGYKAWPSCAVTHPAVDAALNVVRDHDVSAAAIETVTVKVSAAAWPQCNPLAEKRQPTTVMDAKFSIPYTVAVACLTRGVTLRDFTPEQIRDPQVLALAQRVTPVVDPALQGDRGVDPCIVEVRMKSGGVHASRTDIVYGHEDNPMTMQSVVEKFMNCTRYAVFPPTVQANRLFAQQVGALEEQSDVASLLGLLEPPPRQGSTY